ncbi:PDZ domain-containing protein [Paenibacillus xanthanilyticus]|uniref:PDZ domain-containing protein n=1 Tax=Paenibacillus xanthanilyticus TaxID=1783531 RepID=A0ABV8K7Y6_9BACL
MDAALDLLRQTLEGIGQLLLSPFYYVGILLVMLQYRRQTLLERALFHVRLHAWPLQLIRTVVAGLLAGALVSVAGLFLGINVTGEAVLWMWGIAVLLAALSVRYLCFAYSVGVLGVLQFIVGWTPLAEQPNWIGDAAVSLASLDIPGLLVLVAVMHVAEAILVGSQGAGFASPLFLEGKRGKLVGGYMLQGFWPVPLVLLVPGSGAGEALPWQTLLGGGWTQSGQWALLGFPMMIGFSELTRTMLPQEAAKAAARKLVWYGLIVGGAAVGAAYWSPLTLPAAIAALLLHEAMVWLSLLQEERRSPYYVNDGRGLRVLAVIPGTPAEQLGIAAGEILHKVNGLPVRTKEELHAALHVNSAFCKLEVLNLEGHVKFLQRARYANEHHQLGVVLAPDDRAGMYAVPKPVSLFGLLKARNQAKERGTTTHM